MAITYGKGEKVNLEDELNRIRKEIQQEASSSVSSYATYPGSGSRYIFDSVFIPACNLGLLEILGILDFDFTPFFVVKIMQDNGAEQIAVLDSLSAVEKINEWASGFGITTKEMIERIIYRLPENPFVGCATLSLTYEEHERRMAMIDLKDDNSLEEIVGRFRYISPTEKLSLPNPFVIDAGKYYKIWNGTGTTNTNTWTTITTNTTNT